jgi:hypothetical protein
LGRFGVDSDGSGFSGADRADVDADVVVVELDISDSGGVGEHDLGPML